MPELYAIIRIRGRVDVPPDVKHTLKLLRLHKKFHMVIYPSDQPGLKGMLMKVKDWVTWGPINYETLVEVLKKRGRIVGNKPLTDEIVDKYLSKYCVKGGIEGLAKALLEGKVKLHKLEFIKPVFRLSPPKGGFKKSIKRPYSDQGELGYRGEAINDLIKRML
ncbi:MAG: 50S ribosomal protein L30 [Desulfurococcales archaeon ex4484_58]|nr:MAG: 50S ribosomal protein L30 [Desulfurococcales archaeon ex4484_58]